jgi:hypothetical protein|tara:strand:+ start:43 stop:252 length:210 start_codon:yes stop_codon:yes gene_type:complete
MIIQTNKFGEKFKLIHKSFGCEPVNFYDVIYDVEIISVQCPQGSDSDLGTINNKHNPDNLNLVWNLLEE